MIQPTQAPLGDGDNQKLKTTAEVAPECLAFPAGPLLPRKRTTSPPLIAQAEIKQSDRFRHAWDHWLSPDRTSSEKIYRASGRNLSQFSYATQAILHGLTEFEPKAAVFFGYLGFYSENDYGLSLTSKKPKNRQIIPPVRQTYSYPSPYSCDCRPSESKIDTIDAGDAIASFNYIDNNLWECLFRFWLRQLHSHHGYSGGIRAKSKYHRLAFYLLTEVRKSSKDQEMASVAASLSRHARPGNSAWHKKINSEKMEPNNNKSETWPDILNPKRLGDPAVQLHQARFIFRALAPGYVLLVKVDELAREVASLMTDPAVLENLSVRWTRDECEKMYESNRSPIKGSKALESLDSEGNLNEQTIKMDKLEKFSDRVASQGTGLVGALCRAISFNVYLNCLSKKEFLDAGDVQ